MGCGDSESETTCVERSMVFFFALFGRSPLYQEQGLRIGCYTDIHKPNGMKF
jgi:hypothetical protein